MAFIASSRGDSRPCSRPGCTGTVHFGRASENSNGREDEGMIKVLATAACPDPRGWICSDNVEHFRLADSRLLTLVKR